MNELVLTDVAGPVGSLTLNRPERHNSLVPELLRGILAALDALAAEPALRAIVLRANGRSFSTGGDVRAFAEHQADLAAYAGEVVGLLNRVMLACIEFPLPVVAAVHGQVTGGALGLVLASDLVLVAPEASFRPYYTAVGFSPDGGWTALLPAVVGLRRAAEIQLLNRAISAGEAVAWGLANRLVPAERLQAEAAAVAAAIAGQAPGSVRSTKRLLWEGQPHLAERLEAERRRFVQQIGTAEAARGMAAFLQGLKHG